MFGAWTRRVTLRASFQREAGCIAGVLCRESRGPNVLT